ncbi:MAG: NUDIX domain-containing protein [Bacteroidota bacterium]
MSQIYKLFYNNRSLIIIDDIKNAMMHSGDKYYEFSTPSDLIITVRAFEKDYEISTLYIFAEHKIVDVLEIIKSLYKYVLAAGGLVLNEKKELLFIHRFNKWDLPKGHVEAGEEIADAAVREVIEETSVKNLVLHDYIGSTFHVYFLSNEWCIKETHYYEMSTTNNSTLIPQFAEAITQAKWINNQDIPMTLSKSYPSIRDFILTYLKNK